MKKILLIAALVMAGVGVWGQTLETGKVIEYKLPAEDCNTGTFYLGRFSIGKYEISANFGGIHANYTGWKIIVGSNWTGSGLSFKKEFSNINGNFIYQKDGDAAFHLWWDAKYGSGGQQWTPHIKVEYQYGGFTYNYTEPARTNTVLLQSKISADYTNSTVGDARLIIQADTDNNNEGDNPIIQLRQDGGIIGANIGFDDANFGGNVFGICRRVNSADQYDGLFMNTGNGYFGIGTTSPLAKTHLTSFNNHETGIYEGFGDLLLYNHSLAKAQFGAILTFGSHYENGTSNGFTTRAAIKGGTSIYGNTGAGYLAFYTVPSGYANKNTERMRIDHNGNVMIGKTSTDAKLDVAGTIKAEEIQVTLASMDDLNLNGTLAANNITVKANGNTADFVFAEDYNLQNLDQVEAYIKEHKHLPNIPSADEMEAQGVNLAEMNKLLLQKIEELTLYAIEQEEKLVKQEEESKQMREESDELREKSEKKTKELEERLAKIEALLMKE